MLWSLKSSKSTTTPEVSFEKDLALRALDFRETGTGSSSGKVMVETSSLVLLLVGSVWLSGLDWAGFRLLTESEQGSERSMQLSGMKVGRGVSE